VTLIDFLSVTIRGLSPFLKGADTEIADAGGKKAIDVVPTLDPAVNTPAAVALAAAVAGVRGLLQNAASRQ
jgi:hypothetical protein